MSGFKALSPERSAAESKDLQFAWGANNADGRDNALQNPNRATHSKESRVASVYHFALYALDSSLHRLQVKLQERSSIFLIREPRLVPTSTRRKKAAQMH
jgi:hypothetical protein